MKAPLSWLKDFVDIDVSNKELADRLTLSGSKVETIEDIYGEISNVVVGRILELEKHPDAEKLQISKVDIGSGIVQIVTGAQNVKVGDVIPVAIEGATLPGGKTISKGKLRGVESFGMMCSIQELNLTKDDFPQASENGIFILGNDYKLGMNVKEALGLNEVSIEFEITPNRPDCLSVKGLARETAVTLNKPFNDREYKFTEISQRSSDYATVEVKDALCKRYVGKVIKNVKVKESPAWLKARLKAAGVRAINNIVDITNYVMLELGQPMHAFDLDKLSGRKIIVRRATENEMIATLDEQERKLDSTMLVIADDTNPVAIAGVMGGQGSKVTEQTTTILFESANFDGAVVRITGKKLGLRTDSSSRFEKGLDPYNAMAAIKMAADLIEKLEIGDICAGEIDVFPVKPELVEVPFNPDKINSFLGTNLTSQFMKEILTSLEFKFNTEKGTVVVPSFRRDIEMEADLTEEIARFYDYNKIEPTLLSGKTSMQGRRSYKQNIEHLTKSTLCSCGFSECITYSFESPKVFNKLRLPEDSTLRNAVVITNPLGEDFSLMRTSTMASMLEILSINFNRRNQSASLYELSWVYLPQEGCELPLEKSVLTLGMYGSGDFYDMKGAIEDLFDVLGIRKYEFVTINENRTFHPGKTAKITIDGIELGIIGQIHPEVADNFECAPESYIATLDMALIVKNSQMTFKYKQLPKFPAVQRDLSMLLNDEIQAANIAKVIEKKSGNILEEIKLFDVYKGKQVPEGKKSVAYSITFRANDRTLTEDEINVLMEAILQALKSELGAELR